MKITTRLLLTSGIIAALLFQTVVILQALTRTGFDFTRHPLSMLSLGDLGWIQITNFILCGILFLFAAQGMKKTLQSGPGKTFGPLLISIYGIGHILAGIFRVDPMLGFPPGTPNIMPTSMSEHAIIHNLTFFVIFLTLIITQFVFSRRFFNLKQRGWGIYSLSAAIILLLLIVTATSTIPVIASLLLLAGIFSAVWLATLFTKLLLEQNTHKGSR